MNDDLRAQQHAEQLARLDKLLADIKRIRAPSLPEIACQLDALWAAVDALQRRVETLERECDDLRKRELLRFWEDHSP
jgi:hypothetical protein